MDSFLLGHAVQKNGPDLIRHLQHEQQQFPENVIHYLSKYREKPPEFQDLDLKEKICRFISKKADFLFLSPSEKEDKEKKQSDIEDTFAKMPPLETFMGIPETECRKNFFNSVEKHDIVVGVVNSVMDSGLVITLLCLDNGKSRDIDELRISAFCPVKELPKLFPNQDAIEGFQVRDKVRAVVLNVNPETEKLIVSMVERSLPEEYTDIKLALITEDEFPVQYRRKLHIRGLTFDELLHSILGFNNSGNIDCLLKYLDQSENSSLMRGLHGLKIPERDMAENLRKYQSQKMAHSSVAQGITYFKAGKQPEAIQCFNKALDIDKTNVEAFVARGALYANNESFNRAIDDFEDALKINPSHANARKYLHDTLLAYGKSNEDIEKYDEAQELYTKAMSLNQSSVEAREALRFLHYKRCQRRQEEMRRKSSPRIERNESPDRFEQTARTLKKLIKGEDKRHRKKKRRLSRESCSSSSSSRSSGSKDYSSDRRRKRRSRSRDRSQRNRSPPADHSVKRAEYEEPEVLPHQQYGVDPQSSFLSGAGASFSDIFRSSSQESDVGHGQVIPAVPVQYGTNPYLYGNPHATWYGMPGADQTQMFGYNSQIFGPGQMFPDPQQVFYQRNQMGDPSHGNRSRSRSSGIGHRSRIDGRSRTRSSSRRKSPSFDRSPSLSPERSGSRSRSPSQGRKHSQGRSRTRENPRQKDGYRSGSHSPAHRKGNMLEDHNKRSGSNQRSENTRSSSRSWSRSPDGFEESRTIAKRSRLKDSSNERLNRSASPESERQNLQETLEKVNKKRSSIGNSNENEKIKGNKTRRSIDSSKSSEEIKSKLAKKKKDTADEKGKNKKKKKENGEVNKKSKKSVGTKSQQDKPNDLDKSKKSISKEPSAVKLEMNRSNLISSSSVRKKSKEDHSENNIQDGEELMKTSGDIRKVIPKDAQDIRMVISKDELGIQKIKTEDYVQDKTKKKKKREDEIVSQFLRSKWDSPDEMRTSPVVKQRSGEYASENPRSKRSNSREFEGIRIHITNDKFGKQMESKEDLGVVEMFHVNEQPRKAKKEVTESIDEKSSTKIPMTNLSNEPKRKKSDISDKTVSKSTKEPPNPEVSEKKRIYRKRSGSLSQSQRSSSSSSRSRSQASTSPKQGTRSWSRRRSRSHSKKISPPRKRSRSHSRRRSRSHSRRRSRSSRKRSRSSRRRRSRSHNRGRSRSRSRKRSYGGKPWSPVQRRQGTEGFKSRPVIKGRNKFTDSRSPSISPGRKYSGKIRRSPEHHKTSNNRGKDSFRGRSSDRGSFRGRGHWNSRNRHRSRRSRSTSHGRSRSGNRKRSFERRSRSKTPHKGDNKSGTSQKKDGESSKKLVEIEDFYHQLKENKKKQIEKK